MNFGFCRDAESSHREGTVEQWTQKRMSRDTKTLLADKITFPDCIAQLDSALTRFMTRLTGDQIPALRAPMFANNEIVMKEMERRGPPEDPDHVVFSKEITGRESSNQ